MKTNTKRITRIGVLSAAAALLFYIPGIPIVPPIYKLDFSTLPALLGGFSMGPLAGALIVLIKDLVGLFNTQTGGVGELADFLVSASLVVTAAALYRKSRTLKGALIGMTAGVLLMTLVGCLANYYVLIPFYQNVMGFPTAQVIKLVQATIPPVDNLWKLILLATAPFNLIKGLALCGVTAVLYKRISPLLQA
jgi:riboflavin transporter FmnP